MWFKKNTENEEFRAVAEMFEIAGGSVAGRDHRAAGKNNQDAYCWISSGSAVVAVVADGCSSSSHSEVGAWIGARIIAEKVHALAERGCVCDGTFWERIRHDALAQLRVLVNAMGGSFSQAVSDFFLFTIVGALVTREHVYLFSHGDGVFVMNGNVMRIGPFPNNEPPYLAYALVESGISKDLLKFDVKILPTNELLLPTNELQSLVIATDGVDNLAAAECMNLPGKEEKVGPLSQFWENDRYFSNPYSIGRRLNLVNGFFVKAPGLLPDDTTLIALRRRQEGR